MPEIDDDTLRKMYQLMVLARKWDEKLFKLQRSGKIGTYAELRGEEACQIGSALALQKDDWTVPSFRELGVYLARGADRSKIVQSWKGDTRGFEGDESLKDLPVAIPIASQLLHAVGIAWASKLKGEKSCSIVYFGDGATSEGDFHEALNFAGVFKIPVIFFCQNNQWAISTPRAHQTRSETIAQKAIAYGIKSIQIDGNDIFAVYSATKEALENARNGKGPTLIEAVTYRLGDHTTSDDASKYRSEDEVNEWRSRDPIERLRKYLQDKGKLDDAFIRWVEDEADAEIARESEKGLSVPKAPPENLFRNIYSQMTDDLKLQLNELKEEIAGNLKDQGAGDEQ